MPVATTTYAPLPITAPDNEVTHTLALAENMCREMMALVGLTEHGWTFHWLPPATSLLLTGEFIRGMTDLDTKTVHVAPEIPLVDGPHGTELVMIHEMAHAILGYGHGHCTHWAAICTLMGGIPEARSYSEPEDMVQYATTAYLLAS